MTHQCIVRSLNVLKFRSARCSPNGHVVVILHAKAREYVFTGVGLCVCLSVTTITKKIADGFVPNFMRRFLWGKGKTKFVFGYDR